MKKALSIEDFALYLGAPCECASATRLGAGWIDAVNLRKKTITSCGQEWQVSEVKPILRPLSSLTEEEARELYEVRWEEKWAGKRFALDDFWNSQNEIFGYNKWHLIGYPDIWRWLLAHHFDLFGWIESGLALDSDQTIAPQNNITNAMTAF